MLNRFESNNTELAVISRDWQEAQTVTRLSPQEQKKHNAFISAELFKLQTAFPTQFRNFSKEEATATNALWQEVFAGVDIALLHEAVIRFITTERKAFFPSPGQIVGCIEQIISERRDAKMKRMLFDTL